MRGMTLGLLGVLALLAFLLLLAAAGGAAWFLLGGEGAGSAPAPASKPAAPAPAPGAAVVPGKGPGPGPASPPEKPDATGIVEGVVYRDDKPAVATVTAWLLGHGSEETEGDEAWRRWRDSRRLFDGLETGPRARTRSGPDGRWSFRGLGQGLFQLEAVAEDGARGGETIELGRGGRPGERPEPGDADAVIHLEPCPCSLRGRAVGLDGAPWRGIVGIAPGDSGGCPPPCVKTGTDGRFRIGGLPRGAVRLRAIDPGRRILPGPVVLLPFEDEVVFTVGAGLVELIGVVVEATGGRPVPGAAVFLRSRRGRGVAEPAESGPDGRFRVRVADGESHDLRVEAPGFLPEEVGIQADRPDPAAPVEVRLLRPGSLEGRVIAEGTGSAVAGVPVLAVGAGEEAGDVGVESGPEGRYLIEGLRPGWTPVYALGKGWVSKDLVGAAEFHRSAVRVEIPGGGKVAKDLVVVPAARLRGRVVDAAGRGVGGVLVEGWVTWASGARFEWGFESPVPPGKTRSGADGSFERPMLLPGVPYRLTVERDGLVLAGLDVPPISPGATAEVVLGLPEEKSLAVRVVDAATESPVPGVGVLVTAESDPDLSAGSGKQWATGEDGTVSIGPLPAVPLEVSVAGVLGRWKGTSARADVSQCETITLRVERGDPTLAGAESANASIEGTVLLPDGGPATNAAWECWVPQSSGGERSWGAPSVTDFRGRFRVEDLAPGTYRVSADCVRGGRTFEGEVEVPAGTKDVAVRLHDRAVAAAGLEEEDPAGCIRITVLDARGSIVPRGVVWTYFESTDGAWSEALRELEGGRCAVTLKGEKAERAWIDVSSPAGSGQEPLPLGQALFGPFPCAAAEREVRLGPELPVEGRVVDASGNGVKDVHVSAGSTLREVPGRDGFSYAEAAADFTDGEGRFRLARLGDRDYRLSIEATPGYAASAPVVAHGGAKGIVIVLRTAASPVVTVLGYDGKPVAGARVRARAPEESTSGDAGTDAKGVGRLAGLDPDLPCTLEVVPPDDRTDLRPVSRKDWKPADTTVRLEHGYDLEVTVKDPAGRPLPGIRVAAGLAGAEIALGSESTNDLGWAKLSRLPGGLVVVEAAVTGNGVKPLRSAEVTVAAESGKVEIVLDPGGQATLLIRGWTGDRSGLACFARDEDPEPTRTAIRDDGAVLLRGLAPGKGYNVYVRESNDEGGKAAVRRCALLRGVRAGDPQREVDLEEGKDITGKAIVPAGADGFSVAALLGKTILFDGYPAGDGTFRIPAMPDGEWTVVVYLTTPDGKYHAATGTCAAGGAVEIRVP